MVLEGEQLPDRGLRDLPPDAGGQERRRLLGGRQGHEGPGQDEPEGQEEVQEAWRCKHESCLKVGGISCSGTVQLRTGS